MNLEIRKITRNWLVSQECTIVGNWGKNKIDLWEVLDIYAEAVLESDDPQNALLTALGDVADDVEIKSTSNSSFDFLSMIGDFDGCPQVKVYFKGEKVDI